MRWSVLVLVVLVALCTGRDAQARGKRKVDWSEYLESPSSRSKTAVSTPAAEAPTKASKASKASKVSKKSRAESRSKAKATRKRRR